MRISFWDLVTGNDGKLSLSKTQMLLWTMLYISYSAVYMVRTGKPPELNTSAYILMGLSGAAYVGTKAVKAAESTAQSYLQVRKAAPPKE